MKRPEAKKEEESKPEDNAAVVAPLIDAQPKTGEDGEKDEECEKLEWPRHF